MGGDTGSKCRRRQDTTFWTVAGMAANASMTRATFSSDATNPARGKSLPHTNFLGEVFQLTTSFHLDEFAGVEPMQSESFEIRWQKNMSSFEASCMSLTTSGHSLDKHVIIRLSQSD